MQLHEALQRFLHLHDVAQYLIGLERGLEAVVVGQRVGEDLFAERQQPGDGELGLGGLAELVVGVRDGQEHSRVVAAGLSQRVEDCDGVVGAARLGERGGVLEADLSVRGVGAIGSIKLDEFVLCLFGRPLHLLVGTDLLADIEELLDEALRRGVVRVQLLEGARDEQRVVELAQAHEEVRVAEHGLGAEGAEGEGLTEGEVALADHALLLGEVAGLAGGIAALGAFVALATGLVDAPEVDAGDGAAEFGEGLLRVVIADKAGVGLHVNAVHFEVLVVALDVNLLGDPADVGDGGVVGEPVADEALGILAPELVVAVHDFLRHLHQWLAVDLHDDAGGGEVRIHPLQREALLHVEVMVGIFVEHDFGEQSVDGHDGDLAADLDATGGLVVADVLAGFDLARLVGKLLVVVETATGVLDVFGEGFGGVLDGRALDFEVGIDAAFAL